MQVGEGTFNYSIDGSKLLRSSFVLWVLVYVSWSNEYRLVCRTRNKDVTKGNGTGDQGVPPTPCRAIYGTSIMQSQYRLLGVRIFGVGNSSFRRFGNRTFLRDRNNMTFLSVGQETRTPSVIDMERSKKRSVARNLSTGLWFRRSWRQGFCTLLCSLGS